ncbi:MAG: hypothetical protein WKF78_10305 [Candidatus Limnocylindrales bacterium]
MRPARTVRAAGSGSPSSNGSSPAESGYTRPDDDDGRRTLGVGHAAARSAGGRPEGSPDRPERVATQPPGAAAAFRARSGTDPLQKQFINLSVIVLICGAVAITALELGTPLGSPLIKLCALIAAPLLILTTSDAIVRIWRSAWAWMPVDRGKGLFRLAWVVVSLIGLSALVAAAVIIVLA